MRLADSRYILSAALALNDRHIAFVLNDQILDIPEERRVDDGEDVGPSMRPEIVGEGHGTGDPDIVLKLTGRTQLRLVRSATIADLVVTTVAHRKTDEIRRPDPDDFAD